MGRAVVWALALSVAVAVAAGAPEAARAAGLSGVAGVYKYRFQNGAVGGETYVSEDILEIVPVDADRAYVRLALQFYNGHECAISGIAHLKGGDLVYGTTFPGSGDRCRLVLRPTAKGISIFEDENGACRASTCGARGGYGYAAGPDQNFTFARRRPIRYLDRLKASAEFKAALSEDAGAPLGAPKP